MSKTYAEGMERAAAILEEEAKRLERPIQLILAGLVAHIYAEAAEAPSGDGDGALPGGARPGFSLDKWPLTAAAIGNSVLVQTFAEYNKKQVLEAVGAGKRCRVPVAMRAMPKHVVFAVIADAAHALRLAPEQLIQWG